MSALTGGPQARAFCGQGAHGLAVAIQHRVAHPFPRCGQHDEVRLHVGVGGSTQLREVAGADAALHGRYNIEGGFQKATARLVKVLTRGTWRRAEEFCLCRTPEGRAEAAERIADELAGTRHFWPDRRRWLMILGATALGGLAAIPGVEEQSSTFSQIIGVTIAVAIVVIALFFALLTVERVALYGVLKALGARSSTLFGGLVVQAVVITLSAAAIAASLVILLDVLIPPGSIPLYVTPSRLLTSVLLLLAAAVFGCAFSLRRVLRVDPASAIGTSS